MPRVTPINVWNGVGGSTGGSSAGGVLPVIALNSAGAIAWGNQYHANTSGGSFAVTIPAGGTTGAILRIVDIKGTFGANPLTVNASGVDNIEGSPSIVLNKPNTIYTLTFDATDNRITVDEEASSVLPLFKGNIQDIIALQAILRNTLTGGEQYRSNADDRDYSYDNLATSGGFQPAGTINVVVTSFTPATDKVNATAHGLSNGQSIFFTGGTLPTGLAINTIYYVKNATANDFEVSLSSGGATVDFTTAGSGTTNVAQTGFWTVDTVLSTFSGSDLVVSDMPTGGAITSAQIENTSFVIFNQTTGGQTISVQNPNTASRTHSVMFRNTGSATFTLYGIQIPANGEGYLTWANGSWSARLVPVAFSAQLFKGNIGTTTQLQALSYLNILDGEQYRVLGDNKDYSYNPLSVNNAVFPTNRLTGTFTADNTTDTVTATAHGLVNGNTIFLQGATLPTGLTANTLYYVKSVTANTFQLSLTNGGATIDFTTNGVGVMSFFATGGFETLASGTVSIPTYNPTLAYPIGDVVYDDKLTHLTFRCIVAQAVPSATSPSENPTNWIGTDVNQLGTIVHKSQPNDHKGWLKGLNGRTVSRTKYVRLFNEICPPVVYSTVTGTNVLQVEPADVDKVQIGAVIEGAGLPANTSILSIGQASQTKVGSIFSASSRINVQVGQAPSTISAPADINNAVLPNDATVTTVVPEFTNATGGKSNTGSTIYNFDYAISHFANIGVGDYITSSNIPSNTRVVAKYSLINTLIVNTNNGSNLLSVGGLSVAEYPNTKIGQQIGVGGQTDKFITSVSQALVQPLRASFTSGQSFVGVSPEIADLSVFNRFIANTTGSVINNAQITGFSAGTAGRMLNFPLRFNAIASPIMHAGIVANSGAVSNVNTVFVNSDVVGTYFSFVTTTQAQTSDTNISTVAGDLAVYARTTTFTSAIASRKFGIHAGVTTTVTNNNFGIASFKNGTAVLSANGGVTGSPVLYVGIGSAYTDYRVNQIVNVQNFPAETRIVSIDKTFTNIALYTGIAGNPNFNLPVGNYNAVEHTVNRRVIAPASFGVSLAISSVTLEGTIANAGTLAGTSRLFFQPSDNPPATLEGMYIQQGQFTAPARLTTRQLAQQLPTANIQYLAGTSFIAWLDNTFNAGNYLVGQYVDTPTVSRVTNIQANVATTSNITNGTTTMFFPTTTLIADVFVGRGLVRASIPVNTYIQTILSNKTTITGCSTTNGSPIILTTDTTGLVVGQQISGTGIPANAVITSISLGISITISANATATGTVTLASGIAIAMNNSATATSNGAGTTLCGVLNVDQASVASTQRTNYNLGAVFNTSTPALGVASQVAVTTGARLVLNLNVTTTAFDNTTAQLGAILTLSANSTASSTNNTATFGAYALLDTVGTPVTTNTAPTGVTMTIGASHSMSASATTLTDDLTDVGALYALNNPANSTNSLNNFTTIQPIYVMSSNFTSTGVITACERKYSVEIDQATTALVAGVAHTIGGAYIIDTPSTGATTLSNFITGSNFIMSANASSTQNNAIGRSYPYGNGDGTTTFNIIASAEGRVLGAVGVGAGLTARGYNSIVGVESVLLTGQESGIQAFNLTSTGGTTTNGNHGHAVNLGNQGGGGGTTINNDTGNNGNYFTGFAGGSPIIGNGGDHNHSVTVSGSIGNTNAISAHQNMQPTLFVGSVFIYAGAI